MAKAKPIKQKKQNKFLQGLKFLMKSLFSNEACIDGREHKWFWPVIVGVLAALIATIPTMVGYFNKKASTLITDGYSYDLENSLVAFTNETKDVKMEINDGLLEFDAEAFKNVSKDPNGASKDYWGYYYKVPVTIVAEPTEKPSDSADSSGTNAAGLIAVKDVWYCGLAVYYSGEENAYKFAQNKLSNANYDPNFQLGHTDVTKYTTNIIVFGKESMYMSKAVGTSSVSATQVKYDSKSFQGKDLHTLLTATDGENVLTPWANFLDEGYSSTRITLAWSYTGIMFAICVGVIFLMGLLVFIMTRGKNNPFRIYTFWQCQKIAYYASLCPALLGLLAFIPSFAQLAMFLFPMMFILRITWMSMRSLRPQQ